MKAFSLLAPLAVWAVLLLSSASVQAADELDGGVTRLFEEIQAVSPMFFDADADLVLAVHGRDGAVNRLAALVERAARHHAEGRVRSVVTTLRGSMPDARLSTSWPDLDRQGYDRVLALTVFTDGGSLVLQAQAVLLEGRDWLPRRAAVEYPRKDLRLVVTGKPSFVLLERELDDLGPLQLPWRAEAVAVTEGEALDLATVDWFPGESAIAILLADRVEVHRLPPSDAQPLLISLPELPSREKPSRVRFGRLVSCGTASPHSLVVSLAQSDSSLVLTWRDGKAVVEPVSFSAVACLNRTPNPILVSASWLPGGVLRHKLQMEGTASSTKPAIPDRPFLDYLPAPDGTGAYWLDHRGAVYGPQGAVASVSCGQHPVFVRGLSGSWLLACSQAVAQPKRDGVRFFRLDPTGKAVADGQLPATEGRIQALCAEEGTDARLYGLRYLPDKNLSVVERMQP